MNRERSSSGLILLVVLATALFAVGCASKPAASGVQAGVVTPSEETSVATEGTATTTIAPATPTLASPPVTTLLDTPPPGTQVGSPVLITGRTSALPPDGVLGYSVRDSANAQIGSGSFPVAPDSATGGGVFSAALTFTEPAAGGAINLLVFQIGPSGNTYGQVGIALLVAPQTIWIDSPPPGTLVGSPVVITGHTAHLPPTGNLAYRVTAADGKPLGSGTIPLTPGAGSGGSFSVSLEFSMPSTSDPIQIDLIDQDSATGVVHATAGLSLALTAQAAQEFTPTSVAQEFTPTSVAQEFTPTSVAQEFTPTTAAPNPTPTLQKPNIPLTPSVPLTPSQSPTATPCVGFSCPGTGASIAHSPGSPNFDYLPCKLGPTTPRISVRTEALSENDTTSPRNPFVGKRLSYFACNFPDPATLTAELSGPGGTQALSVIPPESPLLDDVKKEYGTNGIGTAQGAVIWNAVCDLPTGAYTLTLRSASAEASLNITLDSLPNDIQSILSVPQAGPAGTTFTFYYCGYTGREGQDVEIDFFYADSEQANGTRMYVKSSEWTIRINEDGWATSSLTSALGDPARHYMLRDRERVLKGFDEIRLFP